MVCNYLNDKRIKNIHDFSLVLSRGKNHVVVGCMDFPICKKTITVFKPGDD